MMDPSKKHSFEDQWKEAFEKASITPPASAWDAIEARLGRDDAEHVFGDQWKKAFDDASVPPPPAMWGQIEARLDEEENNKIFPLWWQAPKMWFAAASVAALLLVGVGMWYNSPGSYKQPVAVATSSLENGDVKIRNKGSEQQTPAPNAEEPKTLDPQQFAVTEGKIASTSKYPDRTAKSENAIGSPIGASGRIAKTKSGSTRSQDVAGETGLLPNVEPGTAQEVRGSADPKSGDTRLAISVTEEKRIANEFHVAENDDKPANQATQTELLASLPYKDLDVYVQNRYVFFKNDQPLEVPLPTKHKEYWAGVGLMPASFNPNVNVKTSPSSFANQSFAKQKSVTGKSAPGISYALQTQGGMRISKHWSVETGISYLQGNSRYEGGGYLLDAATNGFSNVLESALADASAYNGKVSSPGLIHSMSSNSIYIDVTKQVRNDYKYLQLPVQAGFTLNPDGKLSYAVLGGMLANVFVNNELESANGNVIKTTASDEVYRGLNWAATTGLRLNYRLSPKWRASLTGSYQKAITSGFRSNQSLESHPFLYGVSWGMRYSF